MTSKINYVDETWEVTAGCTKVSPGCLNCYAARLCATRLKHHADCAGLAFPRYRQSDSSDGIRSEIVPGEYNWTGEVRLLPHNLQKPLHWRNPRRVFVDSRSDLFHESVPDGYIDRVFDIMGWSPQHTFIVLTKRAERMAEYMATLPGKHYDKMRRSYNQSDEWLIREGFDYKPPPNVWLGVTAENQEQADKRIPHLLQTPATVRFVSVEPMLGRVDLTRVCSKLSSRSFVIGTVLGSDGRHFTPGGAKGVGLNWIICGGESGPGARLMELQWARDLRDQCVSAGVPYFLKQARIDGKLVHMPELDGRTWEQMP